MTRREMEELVCSLEARIRRLEFELKISRLSPIRRAQVWGFMQGLDSRDDEQPLDEVAS